jgi:dTDP-glucose 4,6-dehydratase
MTSGFDQDLDGGIAAMAPRWRRLDGTSVLLTGATGFVGTVLLHTIEHAHRRLGQGPRVTAWVRDAERLRQRAPWVRDASWLTIVTGDVRSPMVLDAPVDFVVHAGNTLPAGAVAADPAAAESLVVDGTAQVYATAVAAGATAFLQVSSGSVSGEHRTPTSPIREDDPGIPVGHTPAARLALAKRKAENWLLATASNEGPRVSVARGFAMCGPWLPLDSAFAFPNFVRDALAGGPVVVGGDGTPVRSFLYATDIADWLWTILLDGGASRAYNVGSDECVTIGELATRIAVAVGVAVRVEGHPVPGGSAQWHVPDISRTQRELGLGVTVSLDQAILRTLEWWRHRRSGAAT